MTAKLAGAATILKKLGKRASGLAAQGSLERSTPSS